MAHKLFTPVLILFIVSVSSCIVDGPMGPPGPQGPQGPTGPQGAAGENGYVFEYENVNFTSPNYEVFLNYPDGFEGLPSDVALVYFLWDVQTIDGEEVEVWRQIPQILFTDYGTLQYSFDFTLFDVRLFMDGNFSLDLLGASYTDQWIVRVVIVPGDFVNGRSIDYSDYNKVKEALGLPEIEHQTAFQSRKL